MADTPLFHDLPDPVTQPGFYADVPAKRLVAFVIDTLAIFALTVVVLPFTGFLGIFIFGFLMMLVGFAYRVITIANRSATWGMRMMAIEFRTARGERFSLPEAFLHTLGLSVSFAFLPLQVISIILMMTTERGQGLTDHVMGSVAINRRSKF